MIKANELRIGNWVNVHFDNQVNAEKIQGVSNTEVLLYNIDGTWSFDEFSGISITPELLENCGFTNTYPHHERNCFGDLISKYKLHGVSVFFVEGRKLEVSYASRELRHIEFVHQLQNLYYALTSTELTVTLHN